jgi:hypothetical protein
VTATKANCDRTVTRLNSGRKPGRVAIRYDAANLIMSSNRSSRRTTRGTRSTADRRRRSTGKRKSARALIQSPSSAASEAIYSADGGSPLQVLVERHSKRFGSRKRLARAMGISLTALSRGVKNNRFNLWTCLKLAQATGESPDYILRCVGKARTADLLDSLFGTGARLRAEEMESIAARLDALPAETRDAFLLILRKSAEAARRPSPRPSRRSAKDWADPD